MFFFFFKCNDEHKSIAATTTKTTAWQKCLLGRTSVEGRARVREREKKPRELWSRKRRDCITSNDDVFVKHCLDINWEFLISTLGHNIYIFSSHSLSLWAGSFRNASIFTILKKYNGKVSHLWTRTIVTSNIIRMKCPTSYILVSNGSMTSS